MKLPRPRFTLRWLMIAVAVVAGILVPGKDSLRLWNIARSRSRQAASMAAAEIRIRALAAALPLRTATAKLEAKQFFERADVIGRRKTTLERAAWLPWLPVPLDP